ncbi:MAG: hypothetical protein KF819_21800 [Labilithrix sp.]|nr:hypothetical protein [Labilithrix sp.]
MTLLVFTFSDEQSRFRRLGARYGGRTHVFGPRIEDDPHWNPCPHGASGAHVQDASIEDGDPSVGVFVIYSWSRDDPVMITDEDGGVTGSPGRSLRALTELRCALGPEGPACVSKSLASKPGAADELDLERVPPLPW